MMERNLFGGKIILDLFEFEGNSKSEIIENGYKKGLLLQKVFNFYDENSELSKLNSRRELNVSDELLFVLKLALKFSKLSKGDYDVTLGKNFLNRKKGTRELDVGFSYKDVKIKGNFVQLLNGDVLIDLGSIAKGYITDKIVEEMKKFGAVSGYVDSRGDIRVFGDKEIEMKIENPRNKGKPIYSFNVKNASVATSGDYNQFKDNYENSHLVNKKDLASVTVISKDLTQADLFATLISVGKKKFYENLLKKNKRISAITIDDELNMKKYNLK